MNSKYISLATIFILSIFLPLINAYPASKCAIGAYDTSKCEAVCFELGVGPTNYSITDPLLTIGNIESICANVKYARQNYPNTCDLNNLLYDAANCACPSCPCTDNGGTTESFTTENFFNRECTSCTCEVTTSTSAAYGYNCFAYGDSNPISEATTTTSWNAFKCPPQYICTDDDGTQYMDGDGFFQSKSCVNQYCYCNAGTRECQTGYDQILLTDNELKAAFLNQCGKDLQGCIDTPSEIMGCGNEYDCPTCACPTGKVEYDRWTKDITSVFDSNVKGCLSCVCTRDGDGNLYADCGEDVDTYTDSRTCPPSGAIDCYYGKSTGDQTTRATYAPNSGTCERKNGQCSWKREYNVFEGETINEWGCEDSMLCEALGVKDGGCAHATNTISPAYFGCGVLSEGFTYDTYLYCGTSAALSNNVDIDTSSCTNTSNNAAYKDFQDTLFNCLMGAGTYTPWNKPVNYDLLKCQDIGAGEVQCQDADRMGFNNGPFFYSVSDYIYYTYGCACETAKSLYESASANTQQLMEDEKDNFIAKLAGFAGQDPVEWYTQLDCNIGKVTCDLASGSVVISPKVCLAGSRLMSQYGILGCRDSNGLTGVYPISGLPALIWNDFDIVKTLCPGVETAAELGLCSSIADLVFPDGNYINNCPSCKCATQQTYRSDLTTSRDYFFGQNCMTCNCEEVNSNNDLGISCTQYGDNNFFGGSYTTVGSYKAYKCPPDDGTVCTNNGNSYLPGQSYWDETLADKFCICGENGQGTCVDGAGNILASDNNDLRSQFLIRCGEDLEGCLYTDYTSNIVSRQAQIDGGEDNPSCPICGCSTAGDVYTVEEIDINNPKTHLTCRTCICVKGGNDDYNGLTMNCDNADPYSKLGDTTCPPTQPLSCYHGINNVSTFDPATMKTGTCASDEDEYCTVDYFGLLGGGYEWQCGDQVLCEAFGALDTNVQCIKSEATITYGWGCGFVAEYLGGKTQTIPVAMSCCNTDNCNNNDLVMDDCTEKAKYGEFIENLFGCVQGEQYEIFSCDDDDDSTTMGSKADLTSCSEFKEYIQWIKGCACTTAGALYADADHKLKAYLEIKVDQFVDEVSTFDGHNINDWNEALDCDFEYRCNIQTGILTVSETFCDIENDWTWTTPIHEKICDICVCKADGNSFYEEVCDIIADYVIPDIVKDAFLIACGLDCTIDEVDHVGEDAFDCNCDSFCCPGDCPGEPAGKANLKIFISFAILVLCIFIM